MADSILIRFGTRSLEQAKQAAQAIAKQVQATAKQLKDLPPELRKSFREAARGAAKQRREELKAQAGRLDLLKRASALEGRDLGVSALLRGRVNQGKEVFEKASTVFGAATSGNLAGGLTLLGNVPVIGQVAAGAAAVAAIVLPILQRELDSRLAAMETRSAVRQQRAFFEADVERRFREDPAFRDQEVRRAVREAQAEENALRDGPWRRRGRYVVGE